ncbi:hypothetical protein M3Y97_00853800 [Aphelenchoides bicaudatus]|nr:hypothetical protein M3Y97_00853800 [Aphelenchoides bicaudatus]
MRINGLAIHLSCGSDQFQCKCGTPECIPRRLVGNKIADCADSSDELPQQSHSVCPDGLPSRDSSSENFVTEFCVNSTHKCSAASGEVCIVFNGKQHCLCKYGYFRAPATLRCVPNSLLPHFLNSENTNCTRLLDDLNKAFPTLFRRVDTPSRKKPKARGVKTSPSIDDNGILNAYETAISLDECNPKVKNSCSGSGEVCDQTANGGYACKCETGRNLINGKCVENVNECLNGNDCDPNAICIDNEIGYECLCRAGYIDTSPTPSLRPGLKCSKLVNECRVPLLNDCDKAATCIDKPIGFSCKYPTFHDISPEGAKKPGRKCQQIVDNCKNIKCAQNAKCKSTIDGHKCLCQEGYIDTSPDLINAPGQSCSLREFYST